MVILLVLLYHSIVLQAQEYIPQIRSLTIKDGLSSNEIHAIHKDQRGFMWIGTQYGLNRYDGTEFKIYSPDTDTNMTISIIHEIFEDEAGYLWLLKKNRNYDDDYKTPEINLLNIYTGEVTTLENHFKERLPFAVEHIQFMKSLADGGIYIYCHSTPGKAYIYYVSTGFQTIIFPEKIEVLDDLILQEDGHFLVKGSRNFLVKDWVIFKIDSAGTILAERKPDLVIDIKEDKEVSTVQFEGENYFSGGYNLDVYHYNTPQFYQKDSSANLCFESINQSVWNNEQQLFWLINSKKVRVVKPDGTIVFEQKEQLDSKRIPILFDGLTTWMSNKREGLKIIHLQPNYFKHYRFFEKDFDNSVRGIFKDDQDSLWVSTIAGQVKLNEKDQAFEIEEITPYFTRFVEDQQGHLWYLHNIYPTRHDFESGETRQFQTVNKWGFSNWDLFTDKEDEVWLSGFDGHIYVLDIIKDSIGLKTTLPDYPVVNFNIYEYQKRDAQSVWLCTNQGLYLLDMDAQHLATYSSEQKGEYYLPTNDVHHIYTDQEAYVWLATGDVGLLKLRQEGGKRLILEDQYNIADGFSSNSLHAIYEDAYGYFWISSDNGLIQFDRKTEKVTKYFTEDGLPHNEFNRIAHHQGPDGRLYFGGLLGVTSFHPQHFSQTRQSYKSNSSLAVSQFMQFSGQKEQFVDLTQSLVQSNTIILQATDQFFNLKVAMLDYQTDDPIHYSYRIKGVYDWQTTMTGNLSISGLPYGIHILEIKAQNNDQQAAANQLAINIRVLRPFYLQWWFVLLVLSIAAAASWWLIKRRTKRLLIQQEARQLKELDEMKSRFFTNISHELRTPLTLIKLPLNRLRKNYQHFSEKEVIQQLDLLDNNRKALDQLVDEILSLSKLEAGKLQLDNQAIRLKDFLARVVGAFQSAAKAKAIDYRFSCFIDKPLIVQLDATKLEMVINNLLSNALKFTAAKGTISIHVNVTGADELVFQVQDSGRGILPNDLPHIFDRYFQTKSKDGALEGGTGIGLAICKEFIELMGGKIKARSEWQEGTTFSFTLRLLRSEQENLVALKGVAASATTPSLEMPSIQHFDNRPTILIAEDHPELRHYLIEMINTEYNVIGVANGREALQVLETQTCQLIVSDIMMPEMDGFTLLEKVRSQTQLCGIPFILLTARASLHDKLQGLRIGVDTYMTKPFEPEELLLNIQNLLRNVQARVFTAEEELVAQEVETTVLKSTPTPPKTAQAPEIPQILPQDMDWLKQVEQIALRELKNKQFGINQLPAELLMSRAQIFRKIKKITGLPPSQYLRTIRLQKAKSILETENPQTITEVCYAVGFENPTYFAKIYKETFGKHPSQLLSRGNN